MGAPGQGGEGQLGGVFPVYEINGPADFVEALALQRRGISDALPVLAEDAPQPEKMGFQLQFRAWDALPAQLIHVFRYFQGFRLPGDFFFV